MTTRSPSFLLVKTITLDHPNPRSTKLSFKMDTNHLSTPAWQRLASGDLLPGDVTPSILSAMLAKESEANTIIDALRGHDAQNFIDSIHKVRFVFFPSKGTI